MIGVLCGNAPLAPEGYVGSGTLELSGSGSGSGSGFGVFQPTTTEQEIMTTLSTTDVALPPIESPPTPSFIKLTFNDLTEEQFHDGGFKENLTKIIVELLMLDSDPQVTIDSENSRQSTAIILIYFGVGKSTIEEYASILLSSNNEQWILLTSNHVREDTANLLHL